MAKAVPAAGYVTPGVTAKRVIGVDLGGTKILAGVIRPDGTIERHRETSTDTASQRALLNGLEAAVREVLDESIGAVGFGIPSRVDSQTGHVERSVNIPLDAIDFRAEMASRLGVPIAMENDAGAATFAEFVAGAGRGAQTIVMLTLGTGVGGGAVLDGRLYRGWAEFGHMVIEFDGEPCFGACNGRGHLEAYVSGTAATKAAQTLFGEAADAHRLVRLANEGDASALDALDDIGRRLGTGIESLVNVFNPEIVVVGGGFAAAGDLILEPARGIVRERALIPANERVRIVRAELGTMAGVIGAGLSAYEVV
jgi:glucokinase